MELPAPDEPALVRADTARLHQVVVNLLANARTHTPPKARRSRPGCAGTGPMCAWRSRTTAPAFRPPSSPPVFERFARGDASRSRHAGSTGLGLALVRAIVTAHGGTVTVESVPGRTVFAVESPAESAVLPTEPAAKEPAQPGHSLSTQP
ncbi:ATP-binding protein [Streptomyces sp. NPDC017988]|uniref:ATP-binding protein n=1 Tax=Streptomyces sp. NPDC017988 TaxID=3365025 RepID=UPI0037BACA43